MTKIKDTIEGLEKMLKMKQDDWLEVCKEYDKLKSELQSLKKKLTVEGIATILANQRGMRHGVPFVKNVLDILPPKLKNEVMEDAQALIKEFGGEV